jgi:hypothetical protein
MTNADTLPLWYWLVYSGVIMIIVFFICRELVCWYWKLNRIVYLLEKIAGEQQPHQRNQRKIPDGVHGVHHVQPTLPAP